MKILILEDSADRIKTFQKNLIGHDVYFFDNVRNAIDAVNLMGPFDVYFLDHDLDDRIFVDSNEPNTGYQFAKFLAQKKVTGQIIIHTLNPAGQKNMKDVLPHAEVVPFMLLFKK